MIVVTGATGHLGRLVGLPASSCSPTPASRAPTSPPPRPPSWRVKGTGTRSAARLIGRPTTPLRDTLAEALKSA
ncbi:hypothetical protein [Microbispora bryophytorum]|uniref:hypothetical protein n=1 Tax=Microbispora bryophytorum TaxID=1460882 RepID=UPI00340F1C34